MSKLTGSAPLVVEDLDCTLQVTRYSYVPAKGPTIRSCWVCNPAHEHLKASKWLVCFVCDKTYHEGVEET